jgi:hypothetical protein
MVSYIDRKYDTTLFTGGSLVNSYIYSFTGMSTDTKPTRTYKNTQIQNGSQFLEMDTGKVFMYNEAAHAWVEFGGN